MKRTFRSANQQVTYESDSIIRAKEKASFSTLYPRAAGSRLVQGCRDAGRSNLSGAFTSLGRVCLFFQRRYGSQAGGRSSHGTGTLRDMAAAGVVHEGLNRYSATHCSLYLMPELCDGMPASPCALEVNALTIAMLEHLRLHPLSSPLSQENHRLLGVLRDQLKTAQCYRNFLPYTDDPLLASVLEKLEKIRRIIPRWQSWLPCPAQP